MQEVKLPLLDSANVKLLIKREDLIHQEVGGNKWRKLIGNLELVSNESYEGIVTYGGAFSNHIHATAASCYLANIPCIGIIRGEYDEQNPTLQFALDKGMKLEFVSREAYRLKAADPSIEKILFKYKNFLEVPEGGSSLKALIGLEALGDEIEAMKEVDHVTVSAGTGMTAVGIIKYQSRPVTVFSALKGDFLSQEISNIASDDSFELNTQYHFGGYGKSPAPLIDFINTFKSDTGIALDPIYNGKAIYGVLDMIKKGSFPEGTTLLHIHTGGLQGVQAYNYMANKKDKPLIL